MKRLRLYRTENGWRVSWCYAHDVAAKRHSYRIASLRFVLCHPLAAWRWLFRGVEIAP